MERKAVVIKNVDPRRDETLSEEVPIFE